MSKNIIALNWRYATKKYNPEKKISSEQFNTLFESIRLSPSSFGLQPYKIIHVVDNDIREKLQGAAWGQPQITEASDLLVFTVPKNLNNDQVDSFIKKTAEIRGVDIDSLSEYTEMIKGSLGSRTSEEKIIWSAKQAYIALGILLTVVADQQIDATPIEGFDPKQFDQILGLDDHDLTSVVVVALGYRADDDSYATLEKVRKSKEELYMEI